MSMKDLIKVWVIKTGYSGFQLKECIKNNVISFDLHMHILDEFEEDLNLDSSACIEDRYKMLDKKYNNYTNKIMLELENNFDTYNYFSDSVLRKEKITHLKDMLENMNNDLTDFDNTMNKFDEFEQMETIKKKIHHKISSINEEMIEKWAFDMVRFTNTIQKGDIVITPVYDNNIFSIARVMSDYIYNPELKYTKHCRKVNWLNIQKQFPQLKKQLQNSSSVFELKGDTREKILEMLNSKNVNSRLF